jgi:hypothetical protein
MMKPLFLFLSAKKEKLLRLGPAGMLALFWLSAPGIAGLLLLYELGTVSEWLRAQGNAGLLTYAATFMLASGTGLLPTTAQGGARRVGIRSRESLARRDRCLRRGGATGLAHHTSCRGQPYRTPLRHSATSTRDTRCLSRKGVPPDHDDSGAPSTAASGSLCLYKLRDGQLRCSGGAISPRKHSGFDTTNACGDDFCLGGGTNRRRGYSGICSRGPRLACGGSRIGTHACRHVDHRSDRPPGAAPPPCGSGGFPISYRRSASEKKTEA